MQTLRRVGMDTGRLTLEEVEYIDSRVVETVRPLLVGRRLFPVFTLPNAGFLTVKGYKPFLDNSWMGTNGLTCQLRRLVSTVKRVTKIALKKLLSQ